MKFFMPLIFTLLIAPYFSLANELEVTSKNLKSLLESNNPKVSASQKEAEAAVERQGYLGRSFLPALEFFGAQENFTIGANPQKSQPGFGAEARVNLFNGGVDSFEEQIRRLDGQKRQFQVKRVLSEELEKARAHYWQVLYLRDKLQLLGSTQKANRQNLNAAQRRIKNGVATDSDRFEFEMKDVDLIREMEEVKVELSVKTQLLGLLLGASSNTAMSFPEELAHQHDYEEMLKHDFKDHEFLFKENEILAEQFSIQSERAGRFYWPKVEAFTTYNQFNQKDKDPASASDRTESVYGLRATISLSAGPEQNREAAALAKESEAAKKLVNYQRLEIEVHLRGEKEELKLLHDQVHHAEENIERAERYYKLTQSEYERGVKNSPDVLGASEKLFDRRHKRLEMIRNFQLSKAHVLSKIGK
jgi:outer membrane protein